jgi:hypothetical protein
MINKYKLIDNYIFNLCIFQILNFDYLVNFYSCIITMNQVNI